MEDADPLVRALQVASLVLVAVARGLALAHALELPGKMRLNKRGYETVQAIYYPGFAWGGAAGEVGGILSTAFLLALTPAGGARFVWTLAGFVAIAGTHVVYWTVTHPVNNFWLRDTELARPASAFFAMFAAAPGADWRTLRNVWEYSHVARAALAMASLVALAVAATS